MGCNYCDKTKGLPKVDHPDNGVKKNDLQMYGVNSSGFGFFGQVPPRPSTDVQQRFQLYRCPLCNEYVGEFTHINHPEKDRLVNYGWNFESIKVTWKD